MRAPVLIALLILAAPANAAAPPGNASGMTITAPNGDSSYQPSAATSTISGFASNDTIDFDRDVPGGGTVVHIHQHPQSLAVGGSLAVTGAVTGASLNLNGAAFGQATLEAKAPNVTGGQAMWLEGGGTSPSNLQPGAAWVLRRSMSANRGWVDDYQEYNSAGALKDSVFSFNPGLQWWDAGHEQSDTDWGGYRNGSWEVMVYLDGGCIGGVNTATNNAGSVACPTTLGPQFSPATTGIYDLGQTYNRWNGIYGTLLNLTLTTPASSSATCTQGTINADASYVYVCTATNIWKRAALSAY